MLTAYYLQQPRYENNLSAHDEWMDKEDVEYIQNRILPSHKKNEILPLLQHGWILKIVIETSEISQMTKDKYHMILQNKWTHKVKQNKSIDTEMRLVVTEGKGIRGASKMVEGSQLYGEAW